MRGSLVILAGALAVILIVGSSAIFTVHQFDQVIVLQFGKVVRVIQEPGLNFKLPFIQKVVTYDRRILDFNNPAEEVIAADQKRLVVDAFARYKIEDPLLFFQSGGTEAFFTGRLGNLLNAAMRRVIGSVSLIAVVSGERAGLMARIRDLVNAEAKQFGVNVIDVRIRRVDLPQENSEAIYLRMQTERERQARQFRAEGEEQSLKIRAQADRQRAVILAEAGRDSQYLRGEGDAEAVRVFAEAFGKDIDFFSFYRSMQAYRAALGHDDTTMVLSPDSDFFHYFGSSIGEPLE